MRVRRNKDDDLELMAEVIMNAQTVRALVLAAAVCVVLVGVMSWLIS
jgi:hypothetical protein